MIDTSPETLTTGAGLEISLVLEAHDTAGALGVVRVRIPAGAAGAVSHHHLHSTEVFHVITGTLDVMIGDRFHELPAGGVVTVEPGITHAFGSLGADDLDVLILLAPAVDRFGYFRLLRDLGADDATLDELLAAQDRFDNHFDDDSAWTAHRTAA